MAGDAARADHVRVAYTPGVFGKGWVYLHVGKSRAFRLGKLHKDEFARLQQHQREFPYLVARDGHKTYWQFQDRFYSTDESLEPADVHVILVTRQRRQRQQIDRAQQIVALDYEPSGSRIRQGIPEDVKQLVWTRDQGRCRNCGTNVELQFDHIIPIALGGSDDPQNLQILCGPCNRRKSASITLR